MKNSFQELMLHVPLHFLIFWTTLPKEHIYYNTTSESISNKCFEQPTLLVLKSDEELIKLNMKEMENQLIQDSNLIGIVFYTHSKGNISEEIRDLFQKCLLPVIQVEDSVAIRIFEQPESLFSSFGRISEELTGFTRKGFLQIASELADAFRTPLLYFDENNQLLWETGKEEEIKEAKRWLNTHMRILEKGQYSNDISTTISSYKKEAFELYL